MELDEIPLPDQVRIADGIAYEDTIATTWADTLGANPLPQQVVDLAGGDGDFTAKAYATAAALTDNGIDLVWVPECDRSLESRNLREVITYAAMLSGARFIWNARLVARNGRISEPDWLDRAGVAKDGSGRYWPGDVKHAQVMEGKAKAQLWRTGTLGSPAFTDAVDTDLGVGRPKKKHGIQLAHYHRHLQSLGFAPEGPEAWGAILGKGATVVWRRLDDPAYRSVDRHEGRNRNMSLVEIYDQEWEWKDEVAAAASDPNREALVSPQLRTECTSCPWRTHCRDIMDDTDELTLLSGVTPAKVQRHHRAGIFTRAQLARLDWRTARLMENGVDVAAAMDAAGKADDGTPVEDLGLGAGAATLRNAGIRKAGDVGRLDRTVADGYTLHNVSGLTGNIDQARAVKSQNIYLKREVEKLSVPYFDIEIDVDMENDPGGFIYLWGTRVTANSSAARQLVGDEDTYRPFASFAGTAEDEARNFAEFWQFLTGLIDRGTAAGFKVGAWCYTAAENRCLRHLARKHAGVAGIPTLDEVDAFIASDHWVDLHEVISTQTIWPTEGLGLKTTAKWARHSWRDDEAGGDASTVWYRLAVHGDTGDLRDENRERLLVYNEDDVVATAVLRQWLRKLMRARKPENRLPSVATLDRRFRYRPARAASPRRST